MVVAGRVPLDVLAERRGTTRAPSTRRSTTPPQAAGPPGPGRPAGGRGGEPAMSPAENQPNQVDELSVPRSRARLRRLLCRARPVRRAGTVRRGPRHPPPRPPGLAGCLACREEREPPCPPHRRGRLSGRARAPVAVVGQAPPSCTCSWGWCLLARCGGDGEPGGTRRDQDRTAGEAGSLDGQLIEAARRAARRSRRLLEQGAAVTARPRRDRAGRRRLR